jgi:hypothetical protein
MEIKQSDGGGFTWNRLTCVLRFHLLNGGANAGSDGCKLTIDVMDAKGKRKDVYTKEFNNDYAREGLGSEQIVDLSSYQNQGIKVRFIMEPRASSTPGAPDLCTLVRPDLYCDGVVTYDFANDAASASLTLTEPDGSERAVSGSKGQDPSPQPLQPGSPWVVAPMGTYSGSVWYVFGSRRTLGADDLPSFGDGDGVLMWPGYGWADPACGWVKWPNRENDPNANGGWKRVCRPPKKTAGQKLIAEYTIPASATAVADRSLPTPGLGGARGVGWAGARGPCPLEMCGDVRCAHTIRFRLYARRGRATSVTYFADRTSGDDVNHELNLDPNTLAVAEAYSTFRLGNGTCWDHSQLGGTTPRGSGRYTTASMYQQQNAYSFGEDRS